MFDESIPSKEDLKLLSNLSIQGENIIEDLYKIFSYHRPKEYKIYVEHIKYNPLDKNKIFIDLISTIQKYNKLVKQEQELYQERGKSNKYFSKLYHGTKYFGKSATSKRCGELLNNLLPKYEQRHMIFKEKFLTKNIFRRSGLLPHSMKQSVEFFDREIKKNGINNYKSSKYIIFIEKLYKQIQKTFERQSADGFMALYESQEERLSQLKRERILKANMDKARRKEIRFDKKEIEKLKKLVDIANEKYQEIMDSINNRAGLKKKKNSKSKSKSKEKEINFNSNKENEIEEKYENNIKILKYNKKEKIEDKEPDSHFSTNYLNKQNRTLFSDNTNNTTFFNNRITTSTGYTDSQNIKTRNHFTFYNIHHDLLNRLNNLKMKKIKEKEKEKEQLMFQPLPISSNTLSRNKKLDFSVFPKISQKNINENKKINLKANTILNNTTNAFKMLKPSSSAPLILNLDSKNQKNSLESNEENKAITTKKIIKKEKIIKKKAKGAKTGLTKEKRKKVPIVYEQLRKIRNILNIKRKDFSQSSKTFELLSEIYNKTKILNPDEKKVPKELYNSYYNMRISIEKKERTNYLFKKYKKMLDKNLEENLEKSKEQDEKLKAKYLDLIQAMINKKLINEN